MTRPVTGVPTSAWRPGMPSLYAGFSGILAGGQQSPGGYCVWVTAASGNPVPVVWPQGFRARLDPLELLGPGGEVVARGGDHLTAGGGFLPVDPARPCMLGQDRAFHVQSGIRVTGGTGPVPG